ncbi:uncharacterized protein VP01_3245g1 [Puccinia sorghi]|uniref:Uncharacterized protein n=1 Tax=Puccinia sorghi TaxID=27349 RepID=A0A0L6UYW8_9BASI|nr:uncharacterized protein VP01_3245g1 [Puccinia sorghi]
MEKEMNINWSDTVARLVGIDIKQSNNFVKLSQPRLTQQILNDYKRPTFTQRSTLPDETLELAAHGLTLHTPSELGFVVRCELGRGTRKVNVGVCHQKFWGQYSLGGKKAGGRGNVNMCR